MKSRAIYTCNVQASADLTKQEVMSFDFLPSPNLDYNVAFKALFFDECFEMVPI